MRQLVWLLKLLLKAAIFFALFAFALNNQHDVTLNFFFGTHWRGPLVLIVLAVFAGGTLLGAIGMMPRWWRRLRRAAGARNNKAPMNATDALPSAAAPLHGP